MTQWYPKMAEYDREGWHTDPYIFREFYGVWGDFDVSIFIDKKYIVGGTGYLLNPQEVGYGYENPKEPVTIPKGKKLKWHFIAPNVHDFSWAADPNYKHDFIQIENGPKMHFLYKNDSKTQKVWQEFQPFAVKLMKFYSSYIGAYPYKQYTIIQGGDGGMEYGMCTLVYSGNTVNGFVGLVAHEMAHAWFQFALATNESKHPWMDEGFSTFLETLALEELYGQKNNFPFKEIYDTYYYMVSTGNEEPLTTHSDRYESNMSYSISAYYKGSVFLAQLSYIMGFENLQNTIREYYRIWGGKHPAPRDFIDVAEKISGLHLGWYLNEFIETTHNIDYGIKTVSDTEIVLERIGRMPMPIELDVEYIDGSKEKFYIPLSLMRGEKKLNCKKLKDWSWAIPTYTLKINQKVKKVTIDSSLYMADINRENNQWIR